MGSHSSYNMSEHESTAGDQLQEVAEGFTPTQQAGLATAAAVVSGALLAVFGLALDVGGDQVIVLLATLALLITVGVVYAFFRAMLASAAETDGDPMAALTYPLFPALFLFLSVGVAAFIGVFIQYVG